jgi:uncharacterized membrane protein YgcG
MVTKNATFFYGFGLFGFLLSYWFITIAFDYSLKQNLIYVASASGFNPAIVISAYSQYEAGNIGMFELLSSIPRVVLAFAGLITFSGFFVIKIIPQTFVPRGYAVFMFIYVIIMQGIDYYTNVAAMDVFNTTLEQNTELLNDAQLQAVVVDAGGYFMSFIATFADDLATTAFISGLWFIGLGLQEAGMLNKLPVFLRQLFTVHPYKNETSVTAKVMGGIGDWRNDISSLFTKPRSNNGSGSNNNGGSGSGGSSGGRGSGSSQPNASGGGGGGNSRLFSTPPNNHSGFPPQ